MMEDELPTTPTSPISPDSDTPSPTPDTTSMSVSAARPHLTRQRVSSRVLPRVRKRASQPNKGSLFDILLKHRGRPLFLRPLCWADIHSTLLGAEFHELPRCDNPAPHTEPGSPSSQSPAPPSAKMALLSRALTEMFQPSMAAQSILGSNAAKTALMTLWPHAFGRPQLLPSLHMFFGDKVYFDAVRVQILWGSSPAGPEGSSTPGSSTTQSASPTPSSSPDSPPIMPLMCYIAKSQLAAIRRNLFRVPYGPNRGPNMPVFRLQQRRAKALTPANADHDSYFAAIFLAMAQRYFYEAPTGALRRHAYWTPLNQKPPRPDFRDLTLRILTHDSNTSELIVYTGHVTAQFLERFHDPWRCPGGDGPLGIKIEYARVPVWPILGLRERLGRALGEDIVGAFDPEQMETWEDDETTLRKADRKRKRGAQGFNGSFDEESEVESNLGKGKKRRLHGSNRVGVLV